MLTDINAALNHLRLPADYPPVQVTPYLLAAESAVQTFCQRKFFATQEALTTAQDALAVKVRDAHLAYQEATSAAVELEDINEQTAAVVLATRVRDEKLVECDEILWGMVVNDAVHAAILLILDHLYENRSENVVGESVAQLSMGASSLLFPYRVRIGV